MDVYTPDEVPRPLIVDGCLMCKVTREDIEANRVIVSPTGLAHFGNEGWTYCGKKADGDDWWWPL